MAREVACAGSTHHRKLVDWHTFSQISPVLFKRKNYEPIYVSYHSEWPRQAVMSDERTIAKTVGVSLTVVFVAILILSAISY
jgi:hypothetical protein